MPTHGDALLELCRRASKEAFLAAPFVKAQTLQRVLEAIPAQCSLVVVTRWIPEEVACGVCDLEIFDLLQARPNTKLLLHPCLHAKYYRLDDNCLVGSANLTATGLGWSATPNIETLLQLPKETAQLAMLESMLLEKAIRATQEIRDKLAIQIEGMRAELRISPNLEARGIEPWLPTCSRPEQLFRIYGHNELGALLTSTVSTGQHDLQYFSLIPGLTEVEFKKMISGTLEQLPVFQELFDKLRTTPVTTEEAVLLITRTMCQFAVPAYDAESYWQIFKTWLLFFFPEYRARPATEVLEVAKELFKRT